MGISANNYTSLQVPDFAYEPKLINERLFHVAEDDFQNLSPKISIISRRYKLTLYVYLIRTLEPLVFDVLLLFLLAQSRGHALNHILPHETETPS